ncbi:MFS transporter [Prescottella agglutinans]|uniref:MFS transporter n=2 Tax=Prescottella agglutinans TaxID=1644129 RepID=A0A438BHC1_9NOCA|nr:MFS transporter [Prescottella agglutinans]RVW10468.1 MFS transporter [Prescottella agglutinans]
MTSSVASASTASADSRSGGNGIVAILGFCGIVVSLMQTLVVPIIPQLPHLISASPADASWAVTATLLAAAVVTPISGRLGDMYGKKRILVASLLLVVLGSVVCAFANSLIPLIVGRALQGASVGVIPLGISILRDELPPRKVAGAMAIVSATLGVGGAVGLPVAAAIAQVADWHVLFWVSAGLGLLCMALAIFMIPESPVRTPGRFDFVGAVGLSAALILFLLPITKGGTWGWGDPLTLGLLAASAAVFVVWGFIQLRTARPLVDLRVSARPNVLFTNLASIAIGFSMYGNSLTLPQLLMAPESTGYGLGLSMITAGIALAPGGLVMMALSPVSAKISAWRGPRFTLMVGSVVVGLGYLFVFFLSSSVWMIVVGGMIIGAGVGLSYSSMPALIIGAVPVSETAAANGLNSLMRSIGTSSAAAVISVVLASMTVTLGTATIPSFDAFRATFVIAIVAAVVALAFASLIPKAKRPAAAGGQHA